MLTLIHCTGFFFRVAVFYVLIAHYIVCPNDTTGDRAVCRGLDSLSSTLATYEPHVRPYITTAQKKIDPYLLHAQRQVEPYVSKVRPYYRRADKFLDPYANRINNFYIDQLAPRFVKGVQASQAATRPYVASLKKQYRLILAPSVDWYTRAGLAWYKLNAEPHVHLAQKHARTYSTQAYKTVSPLYYKGLPRAQKYYRSTVQPFARSSFASSKKHYLKTVHPRVLTVGRHGKAFYDAKILPAAQRFYSLYLAPQLDRISEGIFEYRTKKSNADAAAEIARVERELLAKHSEEDDFEGTSTRGGGKSHSS